MTGEHDRFEDDVRRAVRARLVPPPRGFEDRLLAGVRQPVPVREARSHGWLLTAASLGMAVLVVVVMLWTSPGLRERWLAAMQLPARAVQRAPGPAPAGAPDPRTRATFLYQRATASKSTRAPVPTTRVTSLGPLRRMDWTGAAPGSVVLPAGAAGTASVSASPDGHYLITQVDDQERVLDERGNLVSTWADSIGEWVWADDGRHLCRLPRIGVRPAFSPDAFQIGDVVSGAAPEREGPHPGPTRAGRQSRDSARSKPGSTVPSRFHALPLRLLCQIGGYRPPPVRSGPLPCPRDGLKQRQRASRGDRGSLHRGGRGVGPRRAGVRAGIAAVSGRQAET